MKKVRILDCTLRDGGYCNQWNFGNENIKRIMNGLVKADIDIIECGFLTNQITYHKDNSRFTSMEEIRRTIPEDKGQKIFVCMVNYGEYELETIPEYDGTSVDGIRVAFHKKDMEKALDLCREIKKKGYKVFVQPMISLNYSDKEFLELIRLCNTFTPYAFYIVDSFGVMKRKDLIRLFYMVEHNLKEKIAIGYHSHNNMQLAYSNAQSLIDVMTKRHLIIDTSIFGMGRGAGNLNTELFVTYLNDNIGTTYCLRPLLAIIDEILNKFYLTNYWGYSLSNYLSATHNIHPNYAGYLDDKKTLTVEDMDNIFSMMELEKKTNFDKAYIEALYVKYMAIEDTQEERFAELKNKLNQNTVLLIAPGKSVAKEKEKIIACAAQDNIVSISINFDYPYFDSDFIFISNLRRFKDLKNSKKNKCIVTSNISAKEVYLQATYKKLLNDIEPVQDNAGMMLIKFLIDLGVKKVLLAGIDGYSHSTGENYMEQEMDFMTRNTVLDAMNIGMSKVLSEYAKEICIEFLTEPNYVAIS